MTDALSSVVAQPWILFSSSSVGISAADTFPQIRPIGVISIRLFLICVDASEKTKITLFFMLCSFINIPTFKKK